MKRKRLVKGLPIILSQTPEEKLFDAIFTTAISDYVYMMEFENPPHKKKMSKVRYRDIVLHDPYSWIFGMQTMDPGSFAFCCEVTNRDLDDTRIMIYQYMVDRFGTHLPLYYRSEKIASLCRLPKHKKNKHSKKQTKRGVCQVHSQ